MLAIFKKEICIILKYVFELARARTKTEFGSNLSSSKESKKKMTGKEMADENDAYFKWRHGIK